MWTRDSYERPGRKSLSGVPARVSSDHCKILFTLDEPACRRAADLARQPSCTKHSYYATATDQLQTHYHRSSSTTTGGSSADHHERGQQPTPERVVDLRSTQITITEDPRQSCGSSSVAVS